MTVRNNILEIKSLQKTFKSDILKKNFKALDNISCSFPEGCTTAIVGHNGAGKTTTIRTILGLIKPDAGTVLYKNSKISTNDRLNIGYMPEIHRLTGALTPTETLKIHLKFFKSTPKSQRTALVDRIINKTDLVEHKDKYVKNLSKGLQRRLAFALATIHQPKLVILDEPFSGLDPVAHSKMEEWIDEEKSKGTTIIMCSHQVSSIVKTCDYFHIFSRGKVKYSSVGETGDKIPSGQIIEVTGIDKSSVKTIIETNQIETESWHSDQLNHSFSFKNYPDAAKALKIFLDHGVLVSKFEESAAITESLILNLLREEEQT